MAHQELELKAVVPDAAACRAHLRAAGATPGFGGLLHDRRFDRDGALLARDEVLRVREYRHPDGTADTQLTWKGPTRRSADGYKERDEIEVAIARGGAAPADLLHALGYAPVHAIDRFVETYRVGDASVRLEWYPRMDVLVEVEGTPAGIEAAIAATGLPRAEFTAEPLAVFTRRFAERGGRPALALDELESESPAWEHRG